MARLLTSRARTSERALETDAALLRRLRSGDRSVVGELFERHRGAARATVIALSGHSADADAIVNEAFTSLLEAVERGSGPTEAFRPYLLQCVRHAVFAESNRARRETPTDTMPEEAGAADAAARIDEDAVVAAALAGLPDRWQAVLWMLEVEGRTTSEVAEVLDLRPNAVSALAYRAREGLKESYLVHHLDPVAERECREVNPLLAGYVRDNLRARDTARVESHLATCERCPVAVAELRQIDAQLGRRLVVVFPIGTAAVTVATSAVAGASGLGSVLWTAGRWVGGRWKQLLAGGSAAGAGVAAVAVAVAVATGGGPEQAAPLPPTTTTLQLAVPEPVTTAAPTTAPATTEPATTTTTASTTTATVLVEGPEPPPATTRPRPAAVAPPTTAAPAPTTTEPATTTPTTEPTTTTEPAPSTTVESPTTTSVAVIDSPTTTTTRPPATLAAQPSVTSREGRSVVTVVVTGAAGPLRLHMNVQGDLIPGRMRGEGWTCNERRCTAAGPVGPLEIWSTPAGQGSGGSMRIRVSDGTTEVVVDVPLPPA